MDIAQYVYEQIRRAKSVSLIPPESKLRELGINSMEFIQIIVNLETEHDSVYIHIKWVVLYSGMQVNNLLQELSHLILKMEAVYG